MDRADFKPISFRCQSFYSYCAILTAYLAECTFEPLVLSAHLAKLEVQKEEWARDLAQKRQQRPCLQGRDDITAFYRAGEGHVITVCPGGRWPWAGSWDGSELSESLLL